MLVPSMPDVRECTMPCRWVPVQERSRSLALVYSGMYTGSILGLALSPHLIEVRYIRCSQSLPAGFLCRTLVYRDEMNSWLE